VPVVHGWDAAGVRTYGQYCPIARAADLLAERWSIVILRNVLLGCRTFNEIADGAPGLSRGLLSKRLRDLQRAGVIEIRPKPGGPGSLYEPTQAGRELSDVMLALQHWGSKWAELTPSSAASRASGTPAPAAASMMTRARSASGVSGRSGRQRRQALKPRCSASRGAEKNSTRSRFGRRDGQLGRQ